MNRKQPGPASLRTLRGLAGPVLLCLLAACSAPAPQAPTPSPAASSQPAAGTDVAWAQLTAALNQRALQFLHLVPDRAADPRLVALAADLAAGHAGENARLDALLRRLDAPADNPHLSHDMPGMATATTIAAMSAARGEQFDRLLVASLREHLTQCRSLARSMLAAGRLPDALALAATIESNRGQALEVVYGLTASPNSSAALRHAIRSAVSGSGLAAAMVPNAEAGSMRVASVPNSRRRESTRAITSSTRPETPWDHDGSR